MKITFADLWRPSGTINRGSYALVGFAGFAIKHNLDRLVATFIFHRPWGLFNYWVPLSDVARIRDLRSKDAVFLEGMLAFALPFIWIGVVMTLKRLRSAQLPAWLVCLFFAPFLNIFFFLLLCVMPEKRALAVSTREAGESWFVRLLPESAVGSAAVSLLITVPLCYAILRVGTETLRTYGWGVFVALPFTMGLGSGLIYGTRRKRAWGGYLTVAALSILLLGLVAVGFAMEGLVCLLMAAPIWAPIAMFGGACACFIQTELWPRKDGAVLAGMVFMVAPGVQTVEHFLHRVPETFVVRSSLDIQAPPQAVWKEVIAFSQIPPPKELMFRAGIAYPIRAEMIGRGPGAERHCVFSTGAFVEPIQIWDEPHLLKFSVTSSPSPMEEWTPYGHIDTPHLHGFLESEGGQFLLTPLPNGGTHLEGTTWYQHGLWPSAYWRLWSDPIIHQIHMRVLRHIRDEVEKKSP
jgi:hypothetical protein